MAPIRQQRVDHQAHPAGGVSKIPELSRATLLDHNATDAMRSVSNADQAWTASRSAARRLVVGQRIAGEGFDLVHQEVGDDFLHAVVAAQQ